MRRTLNDPGLSDAMKLEEFMSAHARVVWLEGQRPFADAVNLIADLAAMPGGES